MFKLLLPPFLSYLAFSSPTYLSVEILLNPWIENNHGFLVSSCVQVKALVALCHWAWLGGANSLSVGSAVVLQNKKMEKKAQDGATIACAAAHTCNSTQMTWTWILVAQLWTESQQSQPCWWPWSYEAEATSFDERRNLWQAAVYSLWI